MWSFQTLLRIFFIRCGRNSIVIYIYSHIRVPMYVLYVHTYVGMYMRTYCCIMRTYILLCTGVSYQGLQAAPRRDCEDILLDLQVSGLFPHAAAAASCGQSHEVRPMYVRMCSSTVLVKYIRMYSEFMLFHCHFIHQTFLSATIYQH